MATSRANAGVNRDRFGPAERARIQRAFVAEQNQVLARFEPGSGPVKPIPVGTTLEVVDGVLEASPNSYMPSGWA